MWWLILFVMGANAWWTNEGPSFEAHFEHELSCMDRFLGGPTGLELAAPETCATVPTLWNATFACADAACADAYRSEVLQWTPDTMEWKAATLYGFMYYTTARVMGKEIEPVWLSGDADPRVRYMDTCDTRLKVIWEYSVAVAADLSTTTEEMEETLMTMGGLMKTMWYPYVRSVDIYCDTDVRTNMYVMGFVMLVAVLVLMYVTCCINRRQPMHKK